MRGGEDDHKAAAGREVRAGSEVAAGRGDRLQKRESLNLSHAQDLARTIKSKLSAAELSEPDISNLNARPFCQFEAQCRPNHKIVCICCV